MDNPESEEIWREKNRRYSATAKEKSIQSKNDKKKRWKRIEVWRKGRSKKMPTKNSKKFLYECTHTRFIYRIVTVDELKNSDRIE